MHITPTNGFLSSVNCSGRKNKDVNLRCVNGCWAEGCLVAG